MGALARTHCGLEHKTQSRRELQRAKSRQTLRESARTPPEARGLLSATTKRDTLSKNRKNCLDLVNIEAKRQPQGLGRFFDSPEAHAARPRTRYQLSASPEAPTRKASDEVLILRLARGPARKASDEVPILRLSRGWLGINPVAALTDFSDRTSHPTEAFNHSHNVRRTTAQCSGVTDETEVTSTPCHPGQDRVGVTGYCAQHCAHD